MSGVNEEGYVIGEAFTTKKASFYTKYGDVFAYVLLIIFALLFFESEENKRKNKEKK